MIKPYLLIILLLSSKFIHAQDMESIELPEIKSSFKLLFQPYHSIFVTKDKEIFFGQDKIELQDIKERVYGAYYNFNGYGDITMNPSIVHLFADRSADYKLIDAIKSQIAQTSCDPYLIYRSNFERSHDPGNMYGLKYMLPYSFFKFSPPQLYLTKIEREARLKDREEERKNGLPSPSMIKEIEWELSPGAAVYIIQKEVIREVFEAYEVVLIEVGKTHIEHKGITIELSDTRQLASFFKNYHTVIITFKPDLTYDDYINYLITMIPLENELYQTQFVEYSFKMQDIHKKANIDLKEFLSNR